ncbi:hypothetical protein [Neobacillus terrae]|uniref:hypothetical protein n=1 Tax=Neobacillus terrae TaxID=3034837 RepID=UPI001407B83F|nr:hypothetical protein [Neobacillus terrae]NHM33022.1 hypothetical protein [Neobacillus terrae]
MKKINLLIMLSVLLLGLIACSNQKSSEEKQNSNTTTIVSKDNNNEVNNENATNKDVREKVWEQLKENEKESIKGSWSDGTLTKITLKSSMGRIENTSFIGKEVYAVDFPTKSLSIPNKMIVYAEINSGKIIGYGYVD